MSNRPKLTLRGFPPESEPKPNLPTCTAAYCVAIHEKYRNEPGIYVGKVHAVVGKGPPKALDAIARCECCGGYWDGQKWSHSCLKCGKTVVPGELKGMWVPHSCKECEDKDIADQKARGAVCKTCCRVFSYCYC